MLRHRQLILGLGTGQCGLELLADILNRQAYTRVTLQHPPFLPWDRPQGAPGVRERLTRILETTRERFVGDIASFYLPYAEEALAFAPSVKMVCLKRPREEIVAGFLASLNRNPRPPIDHWSRCPTPPYEHHPLWSRIFPKYDTIDPESGVRMYWTEYYETAEELARRFPDQFRIVDTESLSAESGVRDVLSFCGFAWSDHVPITGKRKSPPGAGDATTPRHPFPDPLDPRRCVVLVPFSGFIHQDCEQSLKELERRGYQVRRVGGYAAIDQGRNQMATDALLDGFEETFWIDSDVAFRPDDVEKIRERGLPIVCGIYPQKGKRALACHVMPGTPAASFGASGGLFEILYAGAGFLHVRREVYLAVQRKLSLPITNERFGHPMIPFFLPMIRAIEDGSWYLAEDYAFCHRARECGYKIYADGSIRLWHIGMYRYGWEDAGVDRPRFDSFTLNFNDRGQVAPPPSIEDPNLRALMDAHPWPVEKPEAPTPNTRDGLVSSMRDLLKNTVSPEARVILSVGSQTGQAVRFLANLASDAVVIVIDPWEADQGSPLVPYETFLAECWLHRDRIIPVRRPVPLGLHEIAEAGITPDAVFVDPERSVQADDSLMSTILRLFPRSRTAGGAWSLDTVRESVQRACRERNLSYESDGFGWRIAQAGERAIAQHVRPPHQR